VTRTKKITWLVREDRGAEHGGLHDGADKQRQDKRKKETKEKGDRAGLRNSRGDDAARTAQIRSWMRKESGDKKEERGTRKQQKQ